MTERCPAGWCWGCDDEGPGAHVQFDLSYRHSGGAAPPPVAAALPARAAAAVCAVASLRPLGGTERK